MFAGLAYLGKPQVAALLALAVVSVGCNREEGATPGDKAAPAITVRTVPARVRTLEVTTDGIGRSEALPNRLVTLTPALEGQVEEILVNLGDSVAKGTPIVQMDAALAQADVAEKRAHRDTLRAALALLEAEPRAEERRGPEIAVEQAKGTVVRASAGIERLRPLRARNEVSAAQLFDAEQALVQARLLQDAAEAQLQLLIVGPRPQAIAEAQARLAAADEALALSQARYDLHRIRSPIDGVVDSLACHPGQTIAAGTPIGEVVDVSQMYVTVWLPAATAARVKPGQSARVGLGDSSATLPRQSVVAAPAAAGAVAAETVESETSTAVGKVFSIGRVVDAATGNLPVRILVENSHARLALGETFAVTIVEREHADVMAVPSECVIDLGEGPSLLVVRDGKIVQLHPVSPTSHGNWAIVSGTDLALGEPVVVDGGFNLPADTPVKIDSTAQAAVNGASE
jgi:HlyD family secretion protein